MRTDAGHGFCLHPSSSSTGLCVPPCLPVFLSVISPVCLPADQSRASKQYTSCFQVCGSPSSLCLLITAGLWKQVYELDTAPFPWQPQTACFLAWCLSGSSSYLSSTSTLSLDSCSLIERRCSLQLESNKHLLTYLKKIWFLQQCINALCSIHRPPPPQHSPLICVPSYVPSKKCQASPLPWTPPLMQGSRHGLSTSSSACHPTANPNYL